MISQLSSYLEVLQSFLARLDKNETPDGDLIQQVEISFNAKGAQLTYFGLVYCGFIWRLARFLQGSSCSICR